MERAALGVSMFKHQSSPDVLGSRLGLLALAGGLLLLPSVSAAQSYNLQVTSGALSSIAGTGTPLSFVSTDDDAAAISPGFSFPFFGTTMPSSTYFYATTNGLLVVDSPSTEYGNTSIPTIGTPDGYIAPFWDDLELGSGSVYWAVQGSSGSYVLVVEWNNVRHLSTSDAATFQVRLYQASGNIELYYGSSSVISSLDWDGSIGVESLDGSVGVGAACNPSCSPLDMPSGTKLVFTPGAGPPPSSDLVVAYVDAPPTTVAQGDYISGFWEVDNYGTGSSGATTIALYAGFSPTVTTSDILLGTNTVASVAAGSYTTGQFSEVVSAPPGTYYLAAIVDPQGLVTETNESNNIYALGAVTVTGGSGSTIYVTTTSLPEATQGSYYEVQLYQTGGTSPTWSIIAGSLPSGITLSSSGILSGTPAATGTFSFAVQAAQSGFTPGVGKLALTVGGGNPTGLRVTTTSLPQAMVGVPYVASVQATGGTPPYAFTVLQGPSWLRTTSSGELSGTPTEPGSYSLLVYVVDNGEGDASVMVPLEVVQPSALALAESLPSAVVGMPYAAQVVLGGRPPYTMAVTSGQLPPGLTFEGTTGGLTGSVTSMGSWTMDVQVGDSNTPPAMVSGQLRIDATMLTELRISLGNEISVYTNADIMFDLQATGGVAPYTWGIVQGALQEGITLDPAGKLLGRVTRVSTATVTFSVNDSMGARAEKEIFVRATVYRSGSGGGGRGGSSRSSGCGCVAAPVVPSGRGASLLVGALGLLAVAGLRRAGGRNPRRVSDREGGASPVEP